MRTSIILGPMIPAILLVAGVAVTPSVEAEERGEAAAAGETITAPDANNEARSRLTRLLKEASLSPGVLDVGRLGSTGAGELVMLAHVNNSETAYRLRAEDIAYLSEHSVPDSIIAAMIERGAILRDRQAAPAPVPAVQNIIHAAPQPASAVVFIPAPVWEPAQPVSTVTVIGRSYGSRGLSSWNHPYGYSRPGQWRNNVSYSFWGGYRSWSPYGRHTHKYGHSRVACR